MQLVSDRICVLNPPKDNLICDPAKVEELLGVPPERVVDIMALRGDAIDNIPGAPGIGDKGSVELIQRFGSVENALEHASEVEKKTYRESLQNNHEVILLSKQLATIKTDVAVDFDAGKHARAGTGCLCGAGTVYRTGVHYAGAGFPGRASRVGRDRLPRSHLGGRRRATACHFAQTGIDAGFCAGIHGRNLSERDHRGRRDRAGAGGRSTIFRRQRSPSPPKPRPAAGSPSPCSRAAR